LIVLSATTQTIVAQQLTIPSRTEAGTQLRLPAVLHKPSGSGPFPAVVVLFGCEGVANPDPLDGKQQTQWIERLVGWGYAALVLDSFTPRGPGRICDSPESVSPETRSQDAFAAKVVPVCTPFC
jgi:dienelactone hydrolase